MSRRYRGAAILIVSGFFIAIYLLSFYKVIEAIIYNMPNAALYYVIVLLPLVLATIIFLIFTMWIGWRAFSSRSSLTESVKR